MILEDRVCLPSQPPLRHVPGGDDGLPVLGGQEAEGAGVRVAEQSAGGGVEAESAHGEQARQMAVGDDGDIALVEQRPDPAQHRVRARGYLLEFLAGMGHVAGNDAVPPQVPADNRRQALTAAVHGITIAVWVNTLPRLQRGEPWCEIGGDDPDRRREEGPAVGLRVPTTASRRLHGLRLDLVARALHGKDRDVVVHPSVAVVEQGPMEPVEQFAGRRRALPTHPLRQREELTGAIPGLRDTVCVKQQLVARSEGEGVDAVVVSDERCEVERWRGRGGVQDADLAAAHEQGRGCPQLRMLMRPPPCGISAIRAVAKRSGRSRAGNAALWREMLASRRWTTPLRSGSSYAASLKLLITAEAAPTAAIPLPRTSPMSRRTPNGVSTAS